MDAAVPSLNSIYEIHKWDSLLILKFSPHSHFILDLSVSHALCKIHDIHKLFSHKLCCCETVL